MTAQAASLSAQAPVEAAEAEALFDSLAAETMLLVAVSGGPDSVALLALLAEWVRQPGRPALAAATVDHGLRQGSAAEAEFVAGVCRRLVVPHTILNWLGAKPETGLQARARAARYALLTAAADRLGGAVLVTAHTLDDQAETVLMRMARGSGPAGLAGMRARSRTHGVVLARPLLGIAKTRLVATLSARGLPHADDPSNLDPRHERVRWRAAMPALAAAGLDAQRLGLLAQRIARMDEALRHRADLLWPSLATAQAGTEGVTVRMRDLLAEPDEIALRVLARALDTVAGEGLARLERLEFCISALVLAARDGSAITRTLSGCVLTLRRDGVLRVRRESLRRRGVHPAAS